MYPGRNYIKMLSAVILDFPPKFSLIYMYYFKGHNKLGGREHFIRACVPSTGPTGKHTMYAV